MSRTLGKCRGIFHGAVKFFGLFSALIALAACSAPPVRPDPPVVVQGCTLAKAPPARPRITFAPCPLEACLDTKNAALWDAYEDDLRAWAIDAYQRCGPSSPK